MLNNGVCDRPIELWRRRSAGNVRLLKVHSLVSNHMSPE